MDLFDLYAKISIDPSDFERGLSDASKKFKAFSANIKGISDGISKSYSGLKDLLSPAVDGFKAVEGVGKKAGNAITTGLKGFAAAATAVGGFGTAAVKSGMEFDATMSEVSAISGATGAEFDSLRDKALEMGAKTKFSASEAASAMTYMGMAGWKAGDMISGIEGIMNLAAASGEDLATTSDIVTDALTAFGLTAADSGHFADILAVASSNANTNVGMMGDTFKYVAPIAGKMGYSAEDTALAIGLMANSGIKASQAGTALRSIISRMAKPTKESAAAMDALGISITNNDGSMKSFNEIIGDMRVGFDGLSEAEKVSYAAMLAGQEAMSGLLAIVGAAPADVEKLTNALEDCNGAAEKMAATMVDNLQGDLTLLGSAFESLQIAISDSLTPTLREFAQFGQKAMANLLEGFQGGGVSGFMSALSGIVTDGVKMLAEKAPEFTSVSLQFIAALADGLLNAADTLTSTGYDVVWQIIDGIGSWISSNAEKLVEVGRDIVWSIFNGFLGATDIISENIGKFIPLIVTAFARYHEALFVAGIEILGATGQGIVESKDEIQRWASIAIEGMVTALRENAPMIIDGGIALLEALVGAILENASMIAETAVDIIARLAEGLGESAPNLIPAAVEAVLQFLEGLTNPESLSNLLGGALQLIEWLIEGITKAIPLLIEYAPEIVANIVTGIIAALPQLIDVGIQLIAGLVEGLIQGVLAIPEAIAKVVTAIVDGFKALFGIHSPSTVMAELGINLIEGLLQGISDTWNSIVEFFAGAVEALIAFLGEAWETIKQAAATAWEAIKAVFEAAWEAIQSAWAGVVDFFSGIWSGIQGVFSTVAEVLGGFFRVAWEAVQTAWNAAKEFFGGIADGIKSAFETVAEFLGSAFQAAWDLIDGVWGAAVDFFSGIWDGISGIFGGVAEWFGGLFSRAWGAVTSAWSGVTEFFTGIWDSITGVFSDVWEKFKEIGSNMLEGLWEGVTGAFGWIGDKIGGVVDGIVGFFTDGLDIHSPSKVMANIGKNVMLGLGEGIDGENGTIDGNVKEIISTMKDAFAGLAGYFTDIGKNAMASLANAMSSGISALQAKVSRLMASIAEAAKAALGIHSPSKVFAGIGENMALGLSKGWDDEYSGIKRKIESGMDFGPAHVGLAANGKSYGASSPFAQNAPTPGMGGNTYNFTFNSPKALDPLSAAKESKKAAQQMALGYV